MRAAYFESFEPPGDIRNLVPAGGEIAVPALSTNVYQKPLRPPWTSTWLLLSSASSTVKSAGQSFSETTIGPGGGAAAPAACGALGEPVSDAATAVCGAGSP